MKGLITMIDSILKIIEHQYPKDFFTSITKEIALSLREKFGIDSFIFIFENERNILKLLGSSMDMDPRDDDLKVYYNDFPSLFEELKKNNIVELGFNEFFSIYTLKEEKTVFFYPIFSGESFMGAVVLSKQYIQAENLREALRSYLVVLKLVVDTSSVNAFREKLGIFEKLSDIFDNSQSDETLINNILCLLKDTLFAEVAAYWKYEDEKLVLYNISGLEPSEVKKNILPIGSSVEGSLLNGEESLLLIGNTNFEKYENPFDIHMKSAVYSRLSVDNVTFGIVAIYNKKEREHFLPYKYFDSIDQIFLNSTVKRMGLGLSRINIYNRLKNEIQNLKELKQRHEESIRVQKEQLDKMNSLHKISQAIRSTYDKNNSIKIMLLGLTSGRGLRFNRALYLERDRIRGFLIPKLWIGPDEDEDVDMIWKEANRRALKYGDMIQYLREEALSLPFTNKLTENVKNMVLVYKGHPILDRVVSKKQVIHVVPQMLKIKHDELEDIYELVRTQEFLIFPVTGRFDTRGIVIIDNKFTGTPITNVDIEIIKLYQDSIGLGLEMIENYDELKEKTKSLEEQKNLIDYYRRFKDNILQNLSVGIVVVDRTGKILEWNQKAEVFFSKARESIIGTSIKLLSGTFNDDILNTIEQIYDTKSDLRFPNYKLNVHEEEKIFDIEFSPLWNRDLGVIEGVIIVFGDITEVYKLQKEIEKREKLSAIGEMTARIAHEIRNPLTVIGGFLNRMLKKLDDPQSIRKYSGIIQSELTRLEDIVSEILEYSRGERLPTFEKVSVSTIVDDVIMMFEDFIAQKEINIQKHMNEQELFTNGDKSRLKQVIINLVKNAIEVVPQKGSIKVHSFADDSTIIIEVENNGTAITPEIKEKLFLPFFTTKTNGTGLGLAICKKIIEEEHKGKLFLLKSDDFSTVFRIELHSC